MTDHTTTPRVSPLMALSILEERLSRGGNSLGPLVRHMGGRLLPAAMGTGAFLYLHGRSLRRWLCAPSRNEKDGRPSIFVHVSHNPPPIGFFPASG